MGKCENGAVNWRGKCEKLPVLYWGLCEICYLCNRIE